MGGNYEQEQLGVLFIDIGRHRNRRFYRQYTACRMAELRTDLRLVFADCFRLRHIVHYLRTLNQDNGCQHYRRYSGDYNLSHDLGFSHAEGESCCRERD